MACNPPDPSVHGIFPARILEWVAMFSSGGFLDPGIEPTSPALQTDSLPLSQQGSPISHLFNLDQFSPLDKSLFLRCGFPACSVLSSDFACSLIRTLVKAINWVLQCTEYVCKYFTLIYSWYYENRSDVYVPWLIGEIKWLLDPIAIMQLEQDLPTCALNHMMC